MINDKRIVPIQKMDLLSMVGTILGLNGTSYTVIQSADVEGAFSVTGSGAVGNVLANQPVKTLNFADGVTSATVYFVAGYDYEGMTINDVAATPTGTVNPDGVTVYKAVLGSSAITITAITPVV